jgi:hypothetical protein
MLGRLIRKLGERSRRVASEPWGKMPALQRLDADLVATLREHAMNPTNATRTRAFDLLRDRHRALLPELEALSRQQSANAERLRRLNETRRELEDALLFPEARGGPLGEPILLPKRHEAPLEQLHIGSPSDRRRTRTEWTPPAPSLGFSVATQKGSSAKALEHEQDRIATRKRLLIDSALGAERDVRMAAADGGLRGSRPTDAFLELYRHRDQTPPTDLILSRPQSSADTLATYYPRQSIAEFAASGLAVHDRICLELVEVRRSTGGASLWSTSASAPHEHSVTADEVRSGRVRVPFRAFLSPASRPNDAQRFELVISHRDPVSHVWSVASQWQESSPKLSGLPAMASPVHRGLPVAIDRSAPAISDSFQTRGGQERVEFALGSGLHATPAVFGAERPAAAWIGSVAGRRF